MPIYLKNNPAEFLPDPICNDGALSFLKVLKSVAPTRRTTRWVAIMRSVS